MDARQDGLRFGGLSSRSCHLCVDMQRLFLPGGPWPAPWAQRILPAVSELAAWSPGRTVFARFIPPAGPGERPGTWQRYFHRWAEVTRERLDPDLLRLADPLERYCPPAILADRCAYSVFAAPGFKAFLRRRGVDTLILSGTETDVCVLATMLQAVDLGLRVIVAADAVSSSSDQGHDAIMALCRGRFAQQIETAATQEILSAWPRAE